MTASSGAASAAEKATASEFVITRTFNAPREAVWRAFTDPERMKEWWGPKGFTVIVSKMDLRVGGTYHYGMRAPDGSTMWGRFVYREIVRPERIVLVNSFSDEAGGVTRHPGHMDWPLEMVTTFTTRRRRAAGRGSRSSGFPSMRPRRSARPSTRDATPCGRAGPERSIS